MKSVKTWVALVVLAMSAILIPSTRAATLEKVLPFTGLDSVRVRMTLRGAAGDVVLSGRIVPTIPGATSLWEGSLGKVKLQGSGTTEHEFTVSKLAPKLWTPATPNLYNLIVETKEDGKPAESTTVRFGFRTFESRDGHLWLNGKPIFIRGIAINPPARGVPKEVGFSRKFAEDYVRFMRDHNVNMIRLEPESDVWFDVCDELGMMIDQGVYGSPPGNAEKSKSKVPTVENALPEYRKIFDNYVHHPSIAIYVLANELPYEGKRGQQWQEFLTKVHSVLKNEYTQPFIGNAGYGQGREGDLNDVHRYWGWYYNSHLTFYNLRNPTLFGDPAKALKQPLTFSECVGAFSGPNGQVNSIFRKQLGAQLNWTGHAEDQVGEMQAYQAYGFGHIAESFRTMRPLNERISGLMPFTILFRNWRGITSFDQMGHNANADQMKLSYAPVLLSWENWTPNVYAGTTVKAIVHVVNDAEDFGELKGATLDYEMLDASGKRVLVFQTQMLKPIPYYGTSRTPIEIVLPGTFPTGKYTVRGKLDVQQKTIATNTFSLFVAGKDWQAGGAKIASGAKVQRLSPMPKTADALRQLGVGVEVPSDLATLKTDVPLVIDEAGWQSNMQADKLREFVRAGGRVLVLGQARDTFDASWLPSKIAFNTQSNNDPTYEKRTRPMSDGMHINPERPWHTALTGIDRDQLKWWSDYTDWDQTKGAFPDIYPVGYGFRLTDAKDLPHTAIIANYDRGLEAIAIAEMFNGKGSVLMTSLRLIPRIGKDPVADRMLRNLVAHLVSSERHELHPLIEQPIKWGNYPTERDVVVEPIGGLVVNCRWQQPPTDPAAKPLPDNEGAWNTKPGEGFVPFGRRVYGPWAYTNATGIRELNEKGEVAGAEPPADAADAGAVNAERDDADNALQKKSKASPIGKGQFWARVPAGRKSVVTKVENTGAKSAKIEQIVNDGKPGSIEVAPGQTATVKSEIPGGATDVNVKFTADKSLVLLETAFQE